MNILLLEDEEVLNKAIKNILKLTGYEVATFYNGDDVLKEKAIYNLYILDINVPGINGLELLKKLKEKKKYVNVIIISALDDIEYIKKAYEYGCIDYLKKPFHLDELLIKVDKALSKSKYPELKRGKYLTKKERQLLEVLLQNNSKIVTYDMIKAFVYENQSVALETIRVLVKRLKDKLRNKRIISNISKEGYKLEF